VRHGSIERTPGALAVLRPRCWKYQGMGRESERKESNCRLYNANTAAVALYRIRFVFSAISRLLFNSWQF